MFWHYEAIRHIMIHRKKDVARVAEVRRVLEEAEKPDAETNAVVDSAKKAVEESSRKEVEAV